MSTTTTTHHHRVNHPYPPSPPPPQPPSPPQATVELTLISAKHLKNVNWKKGPLKPYAILWVDPTQKLTSVSDNFSDTKPVWNQHFSLPLTFPASSPAFGPVPVSYLISSVFLTLELFHSVSAETPKPFVGSLQIKLSSLSDPEDFGKVRSFDLLRPSGRPQGKIRLKIGVNYHAQHCQNESRFSYAPVLPFYQRYSERGLGYGVVMPSAPVDYSPFEPRNRVGGGFGVGVGAVGGMLGGLALNEEEEKIGGCASSTIKDDYSEYRADY